MRDKEILDQMKKLYDHTEWSPENDKYFEEYSKNLLKYNFKKQPKITYTLSKDMMTAVTKYIELYNLLPEKSRPKNPSNRPTKDSVVKVFRIYDDHVSYITFTSRSIYSALLSSYQNLLVFKTTPDLFKNFADISKLKIELLEVYKIISDKAPNKELDKIKETLSKNVEKDVDMFVLYANQIKSIIDNDKIGNNKKWYIYSYTSKSKKIFVWYTDKEYDDEDDIDEILKDKYYVKLSNETHKLSLLCTIETPLEVVAQLATDDIVYKKKSISNGYNKKYLVFNDKYTPHDSTKIYNDLFPLVQRSIMMSTRDDTLERKSFGFIYMITIDGKIFIDVSTPAQTVNDILSKFYITNTIPKKYKKFAPLIRTTKFSDIEIKILLRRKKEKSKIKLDDRLAKFIDKNKATDPIVGLNISENDTIVGNFLRAKTIGTLKKTKKNM